MSSKNFVVKNGISVGENEIVSANGDMFLHGDLKIGVHTLINSSGDLTVPGNLVIGTTTVQSNVNDHANSAFDQANTANQRAVTSGDYANSAFVKANTSDQRAVTSGVYANAAYGQANTATTNAADADQRAVTSGSYANSAYNQANTADQKAVSAGSYANSAYVFANTRYSSSGGTISGDVNITGNLNVTGNTVTHSANDFIVNDPIILLANNNPGNLLDTGYVAHYIEGGTTKHAGLIRDSSANTFYLFDSYVPHIQETNILDPNEATLRISTLKANLVSDSVVVRGYDVVNHTNTAYGQANTATTNAATADQKAVSAGSYANSAFASANTKSPLAGSSSLTTTGTVTSGTWSASFGAVSGANLTSLTAGNLTGTIPSAVLGNSTAYVGTTAITLNRASGSQTLTGVSIDGNAISSSSVGTNTGSASNSLQYWQLTGNTTLNPDSGWHYGIRLSHGDADTYYSATIVIPFAGGSDVIKFRKKEGGTNGSWRTVLSDNNYNSYSPTLTGGGASGTWGISISGNAATATDLTSGSKSIIGNLTVGTGNSSNIYMVDSDESNRTIHCNSDRIGFLTQGGAWGSFCHDDGWWQSDSSVRAPLFYDSNDTGRYLDPTSTSLCTRQINVYDISGAATWSNAHYEARTNGAGQVGYAMHRSGHSHLTLVHKEANALHLEMNAGTFRALTEDQWINNKYFGSGGAIYGTIFYDTNDTGYYTDPASTSRISNIEQYGTFCLSGSGALIGNSTGARLSENYGPLWNMSNSATWHHQVINGSSLCGFTAAGTNWGNGNIVASGYMRSGLMYDHNNTGYYVDPDGTSRLNGITAGNGAYTYIYCSDDESTSGYKSVHANSNVIGFLNGGGGWCVYYDHSGNGVMGGTLSQNSDEKLKKDWTALPNDFIERLATVKHGTYTRIDTGERQTGASANDMQKIIPEVVSETKEGNLSLAYGNAALVAVISLSQRVLELEAKLEALLNKQ